MPNPHSSEIQSGVSILAEMSEVKITRSADDASMLIRVGAVLVGVAAVTGESAEDWPFRFALGWPRSSGEPSATWERYQSR
jgi:hypothetical protein